ncbi:MAG: tRNA (cytidine(56)-2'-O)-methyltransferase [Halodesulfurarchaeum sp.]|nr:tRNA (cytidine(56)-2'-O)-methyltransferase [Halodesulfurarchaeum sp.]
MQDDRSVTVLRLGHRPGRDDRMTTHVGLTARALGADRVVFTDNATDAFETTRDVTERFGGPFEVDSTDSPVGDIRSWVGPIVHLTMYGEPVQEVLPRVRGTPGDDELLVVVGSEKVSFDVYEAADWNVGVTNQPHSEVAALAVFLDRFFEGRELDRTFEDAERRVVPKTLGKEVIETEGDPDRAATGLADDPSDSTPESTE